jgi:hypothetical protein
VVDSELEGLSAAEMLEVLAAREEAAAAEKARKALERPPSPPPVAPTGRWRRDQVRVCRYQWGQACTSLA